jgi:ribonuclease Z
VHVVAVNHLPVRHAFGCIFKTSDPRLAFCGETTYCPALIRSAKGVDMLVHEVLIHRELPIIEGVRSPETVTSMRAYYTVSDQVRKIAKKLVPER